VSHSVRLKLIFKERDDTAPILSRADAEVFVEGSLLPTSNQLVIMLSPN